MVREIPFSTTTESLIASIENAAQKSKIKVASIEDRTAEDVEIVLHLPRGVYADEVVPQLYAYTHCEQSISSNLVTIRDERPVELTVSEVLVDLTGRLKEQIKAELELELAELEDQQHWLTLEQIFIENRVYKRIETARTSEAVRAEVWTGMAAYEEFFIRPMTEDDVDRLLKIPIRRISLYDIEKFRKQIDDIIRAIVDCRHKLGHLTKTTIDYLEGLLRRFGDQYPRRTVIESFDVVSKKEVARQTLKLSYDPESSFFGTEVKGSKFDHTVSEYDKILVVTGDGTYRVIAPPEKDYFPDALWIAPFDEEQGMVMTYLYRDEEKYAWAKKIHITGFIKDKEYEMIKGKKGKIDRFWPGEVDHTVVVRYYPGKRIRKLEDTYDLSEVDFCGLGSRGTKICAKPVKTIVLARGG